ncbi:MAG: hypothetical protein KKF68_03160, partial [Nanoarchaeota archaeon]|nr:hypothetical protein [Nanoarchaeota archaeon]
EFVLKRYERLKNKEIKNFPLIVESKFASLKTKEIISSLKEILGESLFDLALKKRSVRSGRGKLRGRKYKKSAGLLVVLGKEEKLKTKAFDVVNVSKISVNNLAKGEEGRLTLYTEKAINELGEKTK